MFTTRVLLGGKVWKHKWLIPKSRKENAEKRYRQAMQVVKWLRKYNDNPHNSLPKYKKSDGVLVGYGKLPIHEKWRQQQAAQQANKTTGAS